MNHISEYNNNKLNYANLCNVINQYGGNKKYLFVLFQGSGTNLKTWDEYTESKFLDKLNLLGHCYIYQDKIHNIWHYDNTNPEKDDYDSDVDFDLSYVDADKHVKMVFSNLKENFNLSEFKIIPVGWSAGCYLALYFAQIYTNLCECVILLDSALVTQQNMKYRLNMLYDNIKNIYPITNKNYKKLINNCITSNENKESLYKINDINNYVRSKFISENLNLIFSIPVIAFINIQDQEKDEWSEDFNNKRRIQEMNILKRKNPLFYIPYIFKNKTHYIFNKKSTANRIINIIGQYIN